MNLPLNSYTLWFEFICAGLVGLVLLMGMTKKYRISKSLLVFGWLAFIIPTLAGSFLSIPRYTLAIFPVFWILGKIMAEHRKLAVVYLCLSVSLLAVMTILYTRGYWVS